MISTTKAWTSRRTGYLGAVRDAASGSSGAVPWLFAGGAHLERFGVHQQNVHGMVTNGKLRDEFLSDNWFQTLNQARSATAIWQHDYKEVRPHHSIGRIAPARFAELYLKCAVDVTRSNSPTSQID